jgi:ATP-dependent Lhr-like helicase
VLLWREGYVEPLAPPQKPVHVIAQQLMTLVLQQGGIGRSAWREWLLHILPSMQLTEHDVESVLTNMLSRQILVLDGGILGMGPEGERLYSGKNYMDLLSVFDTPPVFTVFSGLRDLGSVHPFSFKRSDGEPAVLSLGGRAWQVTHIDYKHKTAQVVPSEHVGRSRWLGESQPLSFEMCQALRRILLGDGLEQNWSKRAAAEIAQTLEDANCVAQDATVVEVDKDMGRTTWWTFAGLTANSQLARSFMPSESRADNLSVTISQPFLPREFRAQLNDARNGSEPPISVDVNLVKFQECVPVDLLVQMQASRSNDERAVEASRTSALIFRDET